MKKQSLQEQKNATIYQYQLIRRTIINLELIYSYLFIAAIFLGFQLLVYGMNGLFSWLISFAIVQVLHIVIMLLTFIKVEEAAERKWVWRITPPWIGFKPANDITLFVFRRVHRQMFWLGLCVIGLLYPWISSSLMISIICWHLWLLSPRMLLSFIYRKARKDGVLRLELNEASYYHR
ncbi:transposase [Paenibacillus sp. HB172176]|uniref:transposase n=1 Tax=Paenibacillus sp. HB172176 TaxID=2493690 RepID=UPI00143B6006|nr:transposase [Paenibacillus sp. HB172176]